jgi:predicted GNAT family acetyltransferase
MIRGRGEIPFLHAVAANVTVIRLYEQLGFRHRRKSVFSALGYP